MWAAVLVKSFTIEAAETAAALSGSLCMKWIEPHPATGVLFRRALEWIHCRLRPWLLPTTRCMRRRRRPTINTQGNITVYCVQGTQFATEPLWIVTIMIGGREKYHSRNADKLCKRWSKAEFFPECKQIQQTNIAVLACITAVCSDCPGRPASTTGRSQSVHHLKPWQKHAKTMPNFHWT